MTKYCEVSGAKIDAVKDTDAQRLMRLLVKRDNEIEELKRKLDRALKVIKFYADRDNWKFYKYQYDVKDCITFSDVGCKYYTDQPDFVCGIGGRRAREFLKEMGES